jgi:hypothetical protein
MGRVTSVNKEMGRSVAERGNEQGVTFLGKFMLYALCTKYINFGCETDTF